MKVNRSVLVNAAPDRAFRAFVDEIGRWWPLAEGFAFAGDRAKDMFLEGRRGGRLYERSPDGQEFHIGTVRVYEPPARVVFTWGESTEEWVGPTEVEVTFTAQGQVVDHECAGRGRPDPVHVRGPLSPGDESDRTGTAPAGGLVVRVRPRAVDG
jgi:uncharacterized protein YndB with AHSA1/START domain